MTPRTGCRNGPGRAPWTFTRSTRCSPSPARRHEARDARRPTYAARGRDPLARRPRPVEPADRPAVHLVGEDGSQPCGADLQQARRQQLHRRQPLRPRERDDAGESRSLGVMSAGGWFGSVLSSQREGAVGAHVAGRAVRVDRSGGGGADGRGQYRSARGSGVRRRRAGHAGCRAHVDAGVGA